MPTSYNAWLYVYGNPVNLTDPTGQQVLSLSQASELLALASDPYSNATLDALRNSGLTSILGDCWWESLPLDAIPVVAEALAIDPSDPTVSLPDGYFYGGSVSVNAIPALVHIKGADIVYDLRHQQKATFSYESTLALNTTTIGVELGVYEGLVRGFVIDVTDYRGPFVTVSGALPLLPTGKWAGVSAGLSFFSSGDLESCRPNFNMVGGYIGVYPGVGAGFPLFSAGASCNSYKMWGDNPTQYPRGPEGGLMMATEILSIGSASSNPIRQIAAGLALLYSLIN